MTDRGKLIYNQIISPFVNSWLAMLLLGAAHSTDARIPALGYWTTLILLVTLLGVVEAGSTGSILSDRVGRK